ncbi:MAG: nitroreductase family deazaflavin-dependent oxidoreductase [Actinomycetota bacterium]|nr:nitroreductase family deazaflavin-dependent oxidoreductase [Actinomycetota bacterium]
MKLSRRVARFNKAVNNPLQRTYAWLLPPWAVILHRGRRTGRAYRTPVLAFRRDRTLIVALLYGEQSDWVRNLRTGGGRVIRAGRTFELGREPRVLDTEATTELARLSRPARAYCRLADKQLLVEIGVKLPGYGPRRSNPTAGAPPTA